MSFRSIQRELSVLSLVSRSSRPVSRSAFYSSSSRLQNDLPLRTNEGRRNLGEGSSSSSTSRTRTNRPSSPAEGVSSSHDQDDRFSDPDYLDQLLGLNASGSKPSSGTGREAEPASKSADKGFRDLSALFGAFKPKNKALGDFPDLPIGGTSVVSPRAQRGVHSRYKRSQGQTPEEAAAFNQVLSDIFTDLERQGPLRPGSSPLSDPYGNKFESGASLWGPRMAAQREGKRDVFERSVDEDDAVVEELDLLKEEMSLIATDAELVDWARRRVFTPATTDEMGVTFSRAYPRMLAHLLKVVRTNFNNPHLALALFHHAQTHSLESYLSGCLAPAYDELLRVRWESFRDLEGVEQGVREMEVNGVKWDNGTQKIVGKVVEEVGQEVLDQRGELRYGIEVYDRLKRLETRVQKDIRAQEALYERKKANRARVRSGMPSEKTELAFA